jgi:hypothetical protein
MYQCRRLFCSERFTRNAVKVCNSESEYQKWKVHEIGTFLKFESVAHYDGGMCLAVVPQGKGKDDSDMCSGKLGLAECDHPGTKWYNTGGQFLSAICWEMGYSAAMTADVDRNGDCSELTVSLKDQKIPSSQTAFMLLEKDFIEDISVHSQAPSLSSAPSASSAPSVSSVPTK